MVDWEHRSFSEMENSTGEEHHSVFGSPLADDIANRSGYGQSQPGGYNWNTGAPQGNGSWNTPPQQGNGQWNQQQGNGQWNQPQPGNGQLNQAPYGQIAQNGPFVPGRSYGQDAPPQQYQTPNPGQNGTPWRSGYGVSGTIPTDNGGTVVYNPNQPQQYPTDQGPYQRPQGPYQTGNPTTVYQPRPGDNQPNNPNQNGGRAPYGPSGTLPTDGGGTVPYNPNQGGQPYNPGGQPYNPGGGGTYNPGGNPGRWTPAPDQLPGAQQPGQPGMPGRPGVPGYANGADPYRDGTGVTGFGGVPVSDQARQIINNSLHGQFNTLPYFVEGAIGGYLGAGAIPYAMDKLTAGGGLGPVGKIWRDHYSPLQMEVQAEKKGVIDAQGKLEKLQAERHNLAVDLNKIRPDLTAGRTELDGRIQATRDVITNGGSGGPLGPLEAQGYSNKLEMLTKARGNMADLTEAQIRTATMRPNQPVDAGAFLTPDEAQFLTAQRKLFDTKQGLLSQGRVTREGVNTANTAIEEATARVEALNHPSSVRYDALRGVELGPKGQIMGKASMDAAVGEEASLASRLGTGWRGNSLANKAGEGMLAATVGLAADWAGDKILFGNDQVPNKSYVFRDLQGPLMAAAMILPDNMAKKVGYTAAAAIIPQLADKYLPFDHSASSTYSDLMKPNWVEAVGMGAGWMLPFRSPGARVAAVAGGWLLGKGANLINEYSPLKIPGIEPVDRGANMAKDLQSAVAADSNLSHSNFRNVAGKSYDLAMENEAASKVQLIDFVNAHQRDQNPTYLLQGSAAIAAGMGQMQLERGTKLDQSAWNADSRILSGSNLDLGGTALFYFRRSAGDLIQAQNAAGNNNDLKNELKASQKDVEDQINKIYGKHDIPALYDDLKGEWSKNPSTMPKFQVQLKQQVDALQTSDPKYFAKMCRDLALLDLAIAGFMAEKHMSSPNGSDANIMYQEAVKYLGVAGKADPNNPDQPQLQQIATDLGKQIPGAIQQQWNNGFNNPFGVQPGPNGR